MKNALDHAIRSRFLLQYVVYCSADNVLVPVGATRNTLPNPFPFKYVYTLPDESSFRAFCAMLKQRTITYEPFISKKDTWWARFLEPHDETSISVLWTMRFIKVAVVVVMVVSMPFQTTARFIQMLFFRF